MKVNMISVIIPIYNAEAYISECLQSVGDQSYKDFEVICVNDGSQDNSADICQRFVDKDKRFRLINQENGGVSSARNRALKEAKGEYVCFVDSDDVIDKFYLENLNNLAKDGSFAVCSYSRKIMNLGANARNVRHYSAKEYITNIINERFEHPNICMMLFKNSIIQTQHLDFTVGCIRNEDTEFYIKYLMYEEKVASTDYKGYYYRINESSAMHVTTIKSLTSLEASKRMGVFLLENGVTDNVNIILYPSIQSLLYHLCRQHNSYIYDYIHQQYNVKEIMKELLRFESTVRKIIAFGYLLIGKDLFYRVLSSKFANFLPL